VPDVAPAAVPTAAPRGEEAPGWVSGADEVLPATFGWSRTRG